MTMLILIFVLICGPTRIDGITDSADVSALSDLFSFLNSPSQLTSWRAGGDPCDEGWKGIVCSDSKVKELHLPNLGLSGSLGFQLSNMQSLVILDMSSNSLGSSIPYQLPPNIEQINLSGNNLNGPLPYSISQMQNLTILNLSHNQLQGQVPDILGTLSSLSVLDLSYNSFTSDLPPSFHSLNVTSLYLQNNQFTGTVDVLSSIPLENLNVANNRFSGWVPQNLEKFIVPNDGNSWNSGPAPPPPPGTPPANIGTNSAGRSDRDTRKDKKSGMHGGGVAGIVISILVVGAVLAFFIVKRRKHRSSSDIEKLDNQPFASFSLAEGQDANSLHSSADPWKTFEPSRATNLAPPPVNRNKSFNEEATPKKVIAVKKMHASSVDVMSYSIADLQMATGSFSVENLVGEGSLGRIYRAQFDNGKVFAVKKINSSALSTNASDVFLDIVSKVGKLHHPNISELVGYCSEHGLHLLVYEFHKNGSLHDLLHVSEEFDMPLEWNSRVKIALGVARALEYLHEICSPPIVHHNLKSSNILLDTEFDAHISDCGVGALLSNADQNTLSGYAAPEVAMSGQYTLKSDIFSFGVIMLELLTGRKPYDSSRLRAEQSLVRWATPQLHDIDALSKMVDPGLHGLYPVKSLSRFADVIALCVQSEPEFRPPMSEVVQALVQLVQRSDMSKRTVGAS